MQLYKKILVAMDCSSVDDYIVDHVAALALQNDAEVFLLHVIHSHTLDQDRALRIDAEQNLEERCKVFKEKGVRVNTIIRSGEPDDQILKVIDENDFDLVAMATHGHSFLGDLLFGSVSRTLKHKIDIPLLIIKSGQKSS